MIGVGMSLMKPGLLGGPGRRTNGTTIGSAEIYTFASEAIERWSYQVRFPLGLSFELGVWTNRSPPHIVDINVEYVGAALTESIDGEYKEKKRGE